VADGRRAGRVGHTLKERRVHAGRQDIHDLVTRCDKGGDVQTIAILREDRDALQRRVEELESELKQATQHRE
jgi:BMFP domain-containing protein YqiC